jgi:hypothetical protein
MTKPKGLVNKREAPWAVTHGLSHTRSYRAWGLMKSRTLKEWSQVTGLKYATLSKRRRLGLPPNQVICGVLNVNQHAQKSTSV